MPNILLLFILLVLLFATLYVVNTKYKYTKSVAQYDAPTARHSVLSGQYNGNMVQRESYTPNARMLPIISAKRLQVGKETEHLKRFSDRLNMECFYTFYANQVIHSMMFFHQAPNFFFNKLTFTAPTHAIHSAQHSLFSLLEKEDWIAGLNLLKKFEKYLSLLSVKRILMRIETSREKDTLPVFDFLAKCSADSPACSIFTSKINKLIDSSVRVGSELIIDIEKLDFPANSKLMTWIKSDKPVREFIEGLIVNRDCELKERALDYVITIIHEVLAPFDNDRTLKRGSITVIGKAGLKLKSLFDLIGIYEYELDSTSCDVDTIPLPSTWSNSSANTINCIASYVTERQLLPKQNIFYNRTGASSHYKRCKYSQFGIDVAPEKLPLNKQHILYGRTYQGDFWFKLEEHGLADASSILSHGYDYVCSKVIPVAKEPNYRD